MVRIKSNTNLITYQIDVMNFIYSIREIPSIVLWLNKMHLLAREASKPPRSFLTMRRILGTDGGARHATVRYI